jgi:hypothetical protein
MVIDLFVACFINHLATFDSVFIDVQQTEHPRFAAFSTDLTVAAVASSSADFATKLSFAFLKLASSVAAVLHSGHPCPFFIPRPQFYVAAWAFTKVS